MNDSELGSALVRISTDGRKKDGQVVKIGERYFRVKELG